MFPCNCLERARTPLLAGSFQPQPAGCVAPKKRVLPTESLQKCTHSDLIESSLYTSECLQLRPASRARIGGRLVEAQMRLLNAFETNFSTIFSDVDRERPFTCVCEINLARPIEALLYSHFVWGTMQTTCALVYAAMQVLNDDIYAPLRAAHKVPDDFLEHQHNCKAHC